MDRLDKLVLALEDVRKTCSDITRNMQDQAIVQAANNIETWMDEFLEELKELEPTGETSDPED